MGRYFVVENTPGYLPEDDQEGFDGHETLDDAKSELREVVARWREDRAVWGPADIGISEDGTYAWMNDRPEYVYDLGRVASIERAES